MENDQLNNIFELNLNEEGKANFNSLAQYAFVNALIGFISLGISVISAFIAVSRLGSSVGGAAAGSSFVSVLVTASISLLLNITLIKAANNLKKGLAFSDQGHFIAGLAKLATYFRILGILLIIFLVFFILVLLVVIIAGAGSAFK